MNETGEPFDPYYQWLGIPPDEQPPDHYRLLGIQRCEENREVIQNAADRQMVHLRTFQNGPRAALSQQLLNEVAAAKLYLLSPAKKADYDARLNAVCRERAGPPPPIPGQTVVEPPRSVLLDAVLPSPTAVVRHRTSRRLRVPRRFGAWFVLLGLVASGAAVWVGWHLSTEKPAVEWLIFEWPELMRENAQLAINGQPVDLARDAAARDPREVAFTLEPGSYRIEIARPGHERIEQTMELVRGRPTRMVVSLLPERAIVPGRDEPTPPAATPAAGRLVVRWPVAAQAGGRLEVDSRRVDIARLVNRDAPDVIETALRPGPHTLRISLASQQVIDRAFAVEPGQRFELDVANVLADQLAAEAEETPAPPPMGERPPAEELARLREKFQDTYRRFDEFQKWSTEEDLERRDELLRYLLAKLESEAGSFPDGSAEKWAAYDEAIRLAVEGDAYVHAHQLWQVATDSTLFQPDESRAQAERIWTAALASSRADLLADYLKLCQTAGRLPTPDEQARLTQRLANMPGLATHYPALLARITELQDLEVLTPAAAMTTQVAIFANVVAGEFASLDEALAFADRALQAIPAVFESAVDDPPRQVELLIGALKLIRRKALREAEATVALRSRMAALEEGLKQAREWQTLFPRVRSARQTMAQGQATPGDQKLIAFWLLQLGYFREAGPHLAESGEESLVRLAGPPPETAEQRAALADSVDQEAAKSRYSRRQSEALRAYARFLRKSAPESD